MAAVVIESAKPKLSKSQVLYGVSREIYESLVAENRDSQSPRLTYDSGILEIAVSNSRERETDNRRLGANRRNTGGTVGN